MNWNEIAGAVENINRWLRPLRLLEEIPEAIKAAQEELSAIEEKKTLVAAEIETLKSQKVAAVKDLGNITSRVEREYGLKMTAMTQEFEADKAREQDALNQLRQAKEEALKDQKATLSRLAKEKDDRTFELEQVRSEIASEKAKLVQLQEALAKALK